MAITNDELLARLDKEPFLRWQNVDGKRNDRGPVDAALRAVVELHKPDESDFPDEWESCVECSGNGYVAMYPCQTIKVIEKELE